MNFRERTIRVFGKLLGGSAVAAAGAGAWAAAPAQPVRVAFSQISAGDTAWMITASALVLLMTVPGLALFYAGMVRKKNILATMAQSLVGCYWGATGLKRLLRADDSLDVFGVHGVGGTIGALLTGVLAVPAIGGVEGSLATQALGVAATAAYSGLGSALILWIIDKTIGLRVDAAQEQVGLDQSLHGERIE